MAGGLRYETGREMPPGMQEHYALQRVGEMIAAGAQRALEEHEQEKMRIATPAEPARNDGESMKMPYCGDGPEREDLPGCPFCGSDNLLVDRDSEDWYLECNSCLAEGPRAPTQAEAERSWTRRR